MSDLLFFFADFALSVVDSMRDPEAYARWDMDYEADWWWLA